MHGFQKACGGAVVKHGRRCCLDVRQSYRSGRVVLDGPDACSVFGQRETLIIALADHFPNRTEVKIPSYGCSAVDQSLEAEPALTVEFDADRSGLVAGEIAEKLACISELSLAILDPF
jgi:hypothetical protein